jgi:hypothetical protein
MNIYTLQIDNFYFIGSTKTNNINNIFSHHKCACFNKYHKQYNNKFYKYIRSQGIIKDMFKYAVKKKMFKYTNKQDFIKSKKNKNCLN